MNVLSFIIDAKDQATATLGKVKNSFAELGNDWKKAMAGMKEGSYSGLLSFGMKVAPVIAGAGAALKGFGEVIRWVGQGIEENIKLEKMAVQMSRLTGSMRSARAEIDALTKGGFAVDDLFGEEDVIRASMALKRFSSNVIGSAGDIEILAAAAYATGSSVSDVAHSVGLLTGKIIAGEESWGRYAEQLVKSGVVGRDVIANMEQMKASGKGAGEMVAYLMGELSTKYSGTLDDARNALDGIRKSADDAAGDAAKAWGENYQKTVGYFHKIREQWWNLVGFFADHPLSIRGISGGVIEKLFGVKNDESKNAATSSSDIIARGNDAAANSTETDEQRVKRVEAEKKTAEQLLKTRTELYAKLDEAEVKHDEAQMERQEKLSKRLFEVADLEEKMAFYSEDNRVAAEAKILDLKTEILSIQKEISDEEKKAAEAEAQRLMAQENAQNDARKSRLVEQSQYSYHSAYDKMTPEQQLATTEANIKRWQKRVAEAGTEEAKKGATDGLIGQLKERDRLQADMASKADERQKKEESLMTRDRDLKELGMTADQRMAESKKRTADLTKALNAETDPDKQLAIKSKLMDEAEKQQSLAKKADSERSMTIGDVFEKGYGQARRKDPAHEQVDISKEIRDLLKKIETKKGGMAP
jgi:hypothetical protein